jgi:hypothetical protein
MNHYDQAAKLSRPHRQADHRLSPWEEGALRLSNLAEDDGCLIASGRKLKLRLPLEMKTNLSKCLGLKISILRTDTDYHMRILDDQS